MAIQHARCVRHPNGIVGAKGTFWLPCTKHSLMNVLTMKVVDILQHLERVFRFEFTMPALRFLCEIQGIGVLTKEAYFASDDNHARSVSSGTSRAKINKIYSIYLRKVVEKYLQNLCNAITTSDYRSPNQRLQEAEMFFKDIQLASTAKKVANCLKSGQANVNLEVGFTRRGTFGCKFVAWFWKVLFARVDPDEVQAARAAQELIFTTPGAFESVVKAFPPLQRRSRIELEQYGDRNVPEVTAGIFIADNNDSFLVQYGLSNPVLKDGKVYPIVTKTEVVYLCLRYNYKACEMTVRFQYRVSTLHKDSTEWRTLDRTYDVEDGEENEEEENEEAEMRRLEKQWDLAPSKK